MSNNKNNIIWFELSGSLAHFRKPVNLTTKQTYKIPPRTVLTGMLAGGLGFESDSYYDVFDPSVTQVGVEVKRDISTRSISKNYKNTQEKEFRSKTLPNGEKVKMIPPDKYGDSGSVRHYDEEDEEYVDSEKGATYQQETLEYIRQPTYIVYVKTEDDDLFEQLKDLAVGKKWEYSPYFGSNECFVSHKDGGVISGEEESHSEWYVDTVVPEEVVGSIHTTDAFREKMVSNFTLDDGGRKPKDYIMYYYTKEADDDLQVTSDNIYHLENDKYILLY
jgi:CRISPR-associated protein Cas5 subtype I-B